MNTPIGVGIIGWGLMGRTHARAFERARLAGLPVTLRAVATRDVERAAAGAGPTGDGGFTPPNATEFTTVDALLDDARIDAVSICTWTDTHIDLARRALAAGKHVLVEKPVALRADAIRPLIAAARAADRLCMPAMCMRFWPGWPWLRQRIHDGVAGALLELRLTRLAARPGWAPFYADLQRSGGALFDLHIHDVDMLIWCLGAPATIEARGDLLHVRTRYGFAGHDLVAEAEGGWLPDPEYPFRMQYEAVFEEGVARFDLSRQPTLTFTRSGNTGAVDVPEDDAYDAQARHFVERIVAGRRDALATLEDAVLVTEVLEAERDSLRAASDTAPAG